VALAVDQRITVTEWLGHEHHGLVTGGIPVRMKFSEHIADGARRFLVLGGGVKAQFRHGIDNATLHGLKAIAEMRKGTAEDDVHGVVQVRLFSKGAERNTL